MFILNLFFLVLSSTNISHASLISLGCNPLLKKCADKYPFRRQYVEGESNGQDFLLKQVSQYSVGTHKQVTTAHGDYSNMNSFRVFYRYKEYNISPWHDIQLVSSVENGIPLFHFLCEIPKGTSRKMEMNKTIPNNPIVQDTKNGKLRYYPSPSLVNYGALMQTWENPTVIHKLTGAVGDNDPIDVLQLNTKPCTVGEIQVVRAVGVLGLIDNGETDWKVFVVDVNNIESTENKIFDVVDVELWKPNKISALREWFRSYKTNEGQAPNEYAFGGKVLSADFARKIIFETHQYWWDLITSPRDIVEIDSASENEL